MTEDEKIELGGFCASLLSSPDFNRVISEFDKSYCAEMLATKPGDRDQRENIYHTWNGAKTFIGFLGDLVTTAKQLAEANEAHVDDDTADLYEDDDYR